MWLSASGFGFQMSDFELRESGFGCWISGCGFRRIFQEGEAAHASKAE